MNQLAVNVYDSLFLFYLLCYIHFLIKNALVTYYKLHFFIQLQFLLKLNITQYWNNPTRERQKDEWR